MKDPTEIICNCRGVHRGEIAEAVRRGGLKTIDEVSRAVGAGWDCGACHEDIQAILEEVNGTSAAN